MLMFYTLMIVTAVEDILDPNQRVEIKDPSIIQLLFITIVCICSLAGVVTLVFLGVQKVIDSNTLRKKRLAARHPYYYSLISG